MECDLNDENFIVQLNQANVNMEITERSQYLNQRMSTLRNIDDDDNKKERKKIEFQYLQNLIESDYEKVKR